MRHTPKLGGQTQGARWNLGHSFEAKASRRVGRPKKRWYDDINQFVKLDETEETRGNDLKNNDTCLKAAKDQKRWKDMEKDYIEYEHSSATSNSTARNNSTNHSTDDQRLSKSTPSSQTQEEAPSMRHQEDEKLTALTSTRVRRTQRRWQLQKDMFSVLCQEKMKKKREDMKKRDGRATSLFEQPQEAATPPLYTTCSLCEYAVSFWLFFEFRIHALTLSSTVWFRQLFCQQSRIIEG